MLNKEQITLLLQLMSSPQLAIPVTVARSFVATVDELKAQQVALDAVKTDEPGPGDI